MEPQYLESFVATHGFTKAAKLLGVSVSYISLTITGKRPVIVTHDGKRHRAYDVAVYGARKHTSPQKGNAARRFAAEQMGIGA